MDEQEKKAERMIKLTICLCGLFILAKAGQAGLSRYENPRTVLLHEAASRLALWGKELYMPQFSEKEQETSMAQLWMDKMAAFLGWDTREDTALYVEDEYTREELIEAGRGGTLSDIQKENGLTVPETGKQQEDHILRERDSAGEDTEKTDADQSPAVWQDTGSGTEAAVKKDEETSSGAGQESRETLLWDFQTLAASEKSLSTEELLKKYFIVDPSTQAGEDLISFDRLAGTDLTISGAKEGEKQILIYHTHSQEAFKDSVKDDTDTTIVGVGAYLEQLLTEKGYSVLHVTDTFDLVGGKVDRSAAYTIARKKLKEILKENPSIQVILDIHRDGVAENKRLVTTIDGRPTAKLMFFNGLSRKKSGGELSGLANPYIQENLAFSFQTEYLCDYYYPSLSRCIYLKAYRYNLDLLPRSMLVEVGAQTNTVQEAKNAMVPLADVLDKLLQGT